MILLEFQTSINQAKKEIKAILRKAFEIAQVKMPSFKWLLKGFENSTLFKSIGCRISGVEIRFILKDNEIVRREAESQFDRIFGDDFLLMAITIAKSVRLRTLLRNKSLITMEL